ncbi:cell division ATPase MinD [Methanosalsum natronophilum]|uniref:cell division ATPase MinD n=1 Tax=Methanosalsum natronophilum TaxID=768733 RepID=UPI0021679BDA|nr:cell division ATPase MinD [Methanosalsum natronophilum]MCS3923072.1 septum site-determining protein MinD [Methanosalsum natronophilum]
MSAEVYAIASGKGGTGKTTVSINLGVSLAGLGTRVIVIDADIAMPNVGLLLGEDKINKTYHDYIAGHSSIEEIIYEGPGGLKFIPGSLTLDNIAEIDTTRVVELIDYLKHRFDFILIDTAPGISRETAVVLESADNTFLVVNPEISSVVDSLKIKVYVEMKERSIKGIILNRTNIYQIHSPSEIDESEDEIPDEDIKNILESSIYGRVPEDRIIKKASFQRVPAVLLEPSANASVFFKSIASKIAGYEYDFEYQQKVSDKSSLLKKIISLFSIRKNKNENKN